MTSIKRLLQTSLTHCAVLTLSVATLHADDAPPDRWSFEVPGRRDVANQGKDYPAFEVRAVVPARVLAAETRMQHIYARSNMYRTVDNARAKLARSDAYVAAVAERERAREAHATARAAALAHLSSDPEYAALTQLRDRLGFQLLDLRESVSSDRAQVVATAKLKLEYSNKISDRQAAALANHPGMQRTRDELVAAGKRVTDLEAEIDLAARESPDVIGARAQLQQATINRVTAAVNEEAATHARDVALDYASYVHRYDRYKYLNQSANDLYTGDRYRSWYRQ